MKKILIMMTAVIWTLLTMSVPVNAVDMEVHQEADETSEVTAVLEAGTVVLVTDVDAGEGWCRISVKETTGYVRTGHLVPLVSSEEMELEFEQIGNNYHMVFNEVEQLEKQRSQTKMWGAVIAVLTIGLFAAGILPVIRKNREDEKNRA